MPVQREHLPADDGENQSERRLDRLPLAVRYVIAGTTVVAALALASVALGRFDGDGSPTWSGGSLEAVRSTPATGAAQAAAQASGKTLAQEESSSSASASSSRRGAPSDEDAPPSPTSPAGEAPQTHPEGWRPPGDPGSAKPPPMKYASNIDEAALLDQLSASFGATVLEVTAKASGGSAVRVDVYTQLETGSGNAEKALKLAKAAAASSAVLDAYPTASVSVYVWPRDRNAYMTRATATWAEGSLTAPMSTYVDAALR